MSTWLLSDDDELINTAGCEALFVIRDEPGDPWYVTVRFPAYFASVWEYEEQDEARAAIKWLADNMSGPWHDRVLRRPKPPLTGDYETDVRSAAAKKGAIA